VAGDIEFLGDAGEQSIGEQRGAHGKGFVLVAAEPGEEGARGRLLQARRQCTQKVIADGVAEDVVDLLEAVEIDAQDGERRLRLRSAIERVVEPLVEGHAVGQPRQGVVVRHVRNARFCPLRSP